MATRGLDYYIRKKLMGQQFLDISQLAKKVRQIEQLKAEKEGKFKENIKERLNDHQLLDMAQQIRQLEDGNEERQERVVENEFAFVNKG